MKKAGEQLADAAKEQGTKDAGAHRQTKTAAPAAEATGSGPQGAASTASNPQAAAPTTKPAGKVPVRDDTAPSRHSIVSQWTEACEPALLFNCANARCELVSGAVDTFGDATDGPLKPVPVGGGQAAVAGGEPLGRVTVARVKAEPFMSRIELRNKWMVGEECGLVHDGLDRHATIDVAIEWKLDGGAAKSRAVLRVWPWLSYACTAGSRLKVAIPSHEYDGACVTVQRVLEDDRCVCTVDVLDKETVVDPRPDTVLRTSRPAYETGTGLLVLHKHQMRDAIVLAWLGGSRDDLTLGGRHKLRFVAADGGTSAAAIASGGAGKRASGGGAGGATKDASAASNDEEEERDLNQFNHCVQRFADVAAYEAARRIYCEGIIESENLVEDAITGNLLRIEDQLICVVTQPIGETIKHSDPAWVGLQNVHELVDLLLAPSHRRARGVHQAQPTLVRAGPGTGKTWMVKQTAFLLAKRLSTTECAKCHANDELSQAFADWPSLLLTELRNLRTRALGMC